MTFIFLYVDSLKLSSNKEQDKLLREKEKTLTIGCGYGTLFKIVNVFV
jgi:hypothetical protein